MEEEEELDIYVETTDANNTHTVKKTDMKLVGNDTVKLAPKYRFCIYQIAWVCLHIHLMGTFIKCNFVFYGVSCLQRLIAGDSHLYCHIFRQVFSLIFIVELLSRAVVMYRSIGISIIG